MPLQHGKTGIILCGCLVAFSALLAPAQNVAPALTSPAPGSTLSPTSVTFTWTAGSGASQYWLYVGTSAAGFDLFNQNEAANLSATVSGLPTNGSTVSVRLWYLSGGAWLYVDSIFTAMVGAVTDPAITGPTPGSTLTSTSATFAWSAGTGVVQYWLSFYHPPGPAGGVAAFYSSGSLTTTSVAVNGLPSDGSTLYTRLWWTRDGSTWLSADSTLVSVLLDTVSSPTTPTGPATPLLGQSATYQTGGVTTSSTGEAVEFGFSYDGDAPVTWGGGSDTHTWTTIGSHSVRAVARSIVHTNIASWPSPGLSVAVTGTDPAITDPAPGSTLTSTTTSFAWTPGIGVSSYWVYVNRAPGPPTATQFFDSGALSTTSVSVSGLPSGGSTVTVRLFWFRNGSWPHADVTYSSVTASSAGSWAQLSLISSPPARLAPGVAYDSTRHHAVFFGGVNSAQTAPLGDTWEWDGLAWSQKLSGLTPTARAGHAMAFDAAHGLTVLFGGGAQPHVYLSDTWEWEGSVWRHVVPANSPSARSAHSMVFDAARGSVLLFGGGLGGSMVYADTWTWDGTN